MQTITTNSQRKYSEYIKFKVTGDVLEITGNAYEVIDMSDPQNPVIIGGNAHFVEAIRQEAIAFFNSLQTA